MATIPNLLERTIIQENEYRERCKFYRKFSRFLNVLIGYTSCLPFFYSLNWICIEKIAANSLSANLLSDGFRKKTYTVMLLTKHFPEWSLDGRGMSLIQIDVTRRSSCWFFFFFFWDDAYSRWILIRESRMIWVWGECP